MDSMCAFNFIMDLKKIYIMEGEKNVEIRLKEESGILFYLEE